MIRYLLIAVVSVVLPFAAVAEEVKAPDVAQLDDLIQQLGDNSYSVRESAAARLLLFEDGAKPVLLSALDHPDLEIRLRARQLLIAIEKSEQDRRLTAFLESDDPTQDHGLPGWHRFREIVGSERSSRKLFGDMVRREASFLNAFEAGKKVGRRQFSERVYSIQESNNSPTRQVAISAPTLASLLFVGTNPNVNMDSSTGFQMYSLLTRTQNASTMTKGDHAEMLRKLLASWLKHHSSNSYLARNGLMLTLQYDMKDVGLDIARKMLRDKSAVSSTIPYAALTIGKFGGVEDVPALESLLVNETVCHSWHNGQFKEVIKIQVRDVVLAVLVHLTEQDHKEYGFELLRKYERTLFHVYTCAFPKEEGRQAALAKWKAWSEKKMRKSVDE